MMRSKSTLPRIPSFFFLNDTAPTEIYPLPLHDALPIYHASKDRSRRAARAACLFAREPLRWRAGPAVASRDKPRSEEHTSELQSHLNLVCRLLLEKKKD